MLRRIFIYIALVLAATSTARADATTVLVFPFENLSSDRTLDWIGEGIAELIIDAVPCEELPDVVARLVLARQAAAAESGTKTDDDERPEATADHCSLWRRRLA